MERDANKLRAALVNIDKFIKEIDDAIKDEQSAQKMYEQMGRQVRELGFIGHPFDMIPSGISRIKDQESGHEGTFKTMYDQVRSARKIVEGAIKSIQEEERKKSQQAKEQQRRHGR